MVSGIRAIPIKILPSIIAKIILQLVPKISFKPLAIIFAATLLFYLPIFINPNLVFNRSNDLDNFFWPIIQFAKDQILINHIFPLWNNLMLSGTPLLPDPQSPLFYPPNILFLFLPIQSAFLILFVFHSFVGGIGMYLLCLKGFKLENKTCIFSALLYTLSPKFSGYLDAGHWGLITSWAWLPFALFTTLKIIEKPSVARSIALSVILSFIFLTHASTFVIVSASLFIIFVYGFFKQKNRLTYTKYLVLSVLLLLGLTAITLLPQIEWIPHTTRSLLTNSHDVYPKWISRNEFISNLIIPWINGFESVPSIDSEKWIVFGIGTTILAIYGFFYLSRNMKVTTAIVTFTIVLIGLNNFSPVYSVLISQPWYNLLRVSTRLWFILIILAIFLASKGFEKLKSVHKNIAYFLVILSIAETTFLSWSKFSPLKAGESKLVSQEVINYLKSDPDLFRVYCTTRCISQKQSAINNVELIDGYSTLISLNYFKHSWQLAGGYWNYYTLAIPPYGADLEKLKPNIDSLAKYNVKYLLSSHPINDPRLSKDRTIDSTIIYRIPNYKARAYFLSDNGLTTNADILSYTPNSIRINTQDNNDSKLIVANVYNNGWTAYINGNTKAEILETPDNLWQVDLPKGQVTFVDFIYQPLSYFIGRAITSTTLIFIVLALAKRSFTKYK